VEEFVFEVEGGAGSGVHHDDVGAVLLEDEAVVFFGGVVGADVEDAELAGGVADDAGVVAEDEEAEVAVVVHDGFFAEVLALVGGEGEAIGAAGFFFVVGDEFFEIVEEGFAAVGALAVGAAGELHLEEAEVEAHLEFFAAVEAGDFADVDGAGFVVPALEEGGDVSAGFAGVVAVVVLVWWSGF